MIRCLASRLIKSQLPTCSNLIVPLTKCFYRCQWTNIAVCAQLIDEKKKKMSIAVYHGCRFLWGHFINLVVLKVVEIAPAFQLDPHLRDRLHADAVNLAKQVRFLKKKMMKGKPQIIGLTYNMNPFSHETKWKIPTGLDTCRFQHFWQ